MEVALQEARRALEAGEVPVGVVVVVRGEVVAVARNDTRAVDATRHAEVLLMDQLPRETLEAAHLFVTVEPCVMCATAIAMMGVPHVTFACRNPKFGGFGSVMDVCATYDLNTHVHIDYENQPHAIALLRQFYAQKNPRI